MEKAKEKIQLDYWGTYLIYTLKIYYITGYDRER